MKIVLILMVLFVFGTLIAASYGNRHMVYDPNPTHMFHKKNCHTLGKGWYSCKRKDH